MSRTLKGILLAGTTGLCWGLTTLATKLIGGAGVAVSTAVFARMVVVVAALGPWLRLRPELQARIDKAREEIKSGKCVTLKSSEDIDAYFDSL